LEGESININTLLDENRTNHYKLLTVVGNNHHKADSIIKYLEKHGWQVYDVEEKVIEISENIPHEKIKLRIGREIKRWIRSLNDQVVLTNSNILYSEDMGKINPFNAFKYSMRSDREGVLLLDAKLKGNLAIYSTPDRPDYQEFELNDVLFVDIEKVRAPGVLI
jgi:hypothetical protein